MATTSTIEEAPVMAIVRDMEKAISALRDRLPFITDPSELGDAVIGLHQITASLDGLRAQLSGQASANGVPQSVGVRTMGQFVGSQTNASPFVARRDANLHRWVRDYPIFASAFYVGQITTEHIRVIRKIENSRSAGLLGSAQQILVDAAIGVETFAAFEQVCGYWLTHVDPDGEEPLDQLDKNGVSFRSGSGGRGKIVIDADAINFAAFKKMVHHRADRMRTDQGALPSPLAEEQDRFAAVMSLLVDGFARKDGTLPVPIVNVVMSERVAAWAYGQLTGDPTTDFVPVDALDVDGRCELIDGTPVHPLLVAAMCGMWRFRPPVLRRYILNAKGRIVDYSYNARTAPEHLRTASLIEHRGLCSTPGCDAPHHWLQMDHVEPHSLGGPTSLPNTEPKCRPDNFAKGNRRTLVPSARRWKSTGASGGRLNGSDPTLFKLRI